MDSYLHPEKLLLQNAEAALTHICTSSALEISSGILDKGSLMVPVQFTGTFMAVTNPSRTAFPPCCPAIIGSKWGTLSFKRRLMTGKHMVGRSHVQLLHHGPSAARQAIGVKILTAQFVWQVWKAEGLEVVWSLGLQISFKESGDTIATSSMKNVLVITFCIWTPQREV